MRQFMCCKGQWAGSRAATSDRRGKLLPQLGCLVKMRTSANSRAAAAHDLKQVRSNAWEREGLRRVQMKFLTFQKGSAEKPLKKLLFGCGARCCLFLPKHAIMYYSQICLFEVKVIYLAFLSCDMFRIIYIYTYIFVPVTQVRINYNESM